MRKPLTLETLESLEDGDYILLTSKNVFIRTVHLKEHDTVPREPGEISLSQFLKGWPKGNGYILAIKDIDLSSYK